MGVVSHLVSWSGWGSLLPALQSPRLTAELGWVVAALSLAVFSLVRHIVSNDAAAGRPAGWRTAVSLLPFVLVAAAPRAVVVVASVWWLAGALATRSARERRPEPPLPNPLDAADDVGSDFAQALKRYAPQYVNPPEKWGLAEREILPWLVEQARADLEFASRKTESLADRVVRASQTALTLLTVIATAGAIAFVEWSNKPWILTLSCISVGCFAVAVFRASATYRPFHTDMAYRPADWLTVLSGHSAMFVRILYLRSVDYLVRQEESQNAYVHEMSRSCDAWTIAGVLFLITGVVLQLVALAFAR